MLYSASNDSFVKQWDVRCLAGAGVPRCVKSYNGHIVSILCASDTQDFAMAVACSRDGRWVASGGRDRCLQLWDPRTGLFQINLQGHKETGLFFLRTHTQSSPSTSAPPTICW